MKTYILGFKFKLSIKSTRGCMCGCKCIKKDKLFFILFVKVDHAMWGEKYGLPKIMFSKGIIWGFPRYGVRLGPSGTGQVSGVT